MRIRDLCYKPRQQCSLNCNSLVLLTLNSIVTRLELNVAVQNVTRRANLGLTRRCQGKNDALLSTSQLSAARVGQKQLSVCRVRRQNRAKGSPVQRKGGLLGISSKVHAVQ